MLFKFKVCFVFYKIKYPSKNIVLDFINILSSGYRIDLKYKICIVWL